MSTRDDPGGGVGTMIRGVMEPLSLLRAWMWDLHRMGCPVSPATARAAERAVRVALEAGAPPAVAVNRGRDILRRDSHPGRAGQ